MAGDTRIVSGNQNNGPIYAAQVRHGQRSDYLLVAQVNVSGDIVNPGGAGGSGGDGAILDGANSAIKATVKQYGNSNPIAVVLVNASGDAYGIQPGAAASNVNINQVGGNATAVNAGTADNGTLRVIIASDQTVPVSFPGGVASTQAGGWAVGVTGDVSTTPKAGQTWPVKEQNILGVQIVGGGGHGTVGVTGDVQSRQSGAWAIAVTGDVLLRANPNVIIGQFGNTVGVNIIGGSVGGRFSASGDLSVIPSTSNFNKFPTSGDSRIMDGADNTIKATVKSYANAKPLAVVLVNVSGDVYNAGGGGGAASNININQVGGVATSVNAGTADNGTLRVVVASDQGTIPVSGSFTAQVTAPSFQTIGGLVGISGDSRVSQGGGWAVSLTGDSANPVNTKPAGGQVWPVREQSVTGVQVVGGSLGGTVNLSGDAYVTQRGAWATAVTGDVLLRAGGPTIPVSLAGPVGVQIIGGAVGGRFSASGDLNVIPSTSNFNKFPTSGDTRIMDGADNTIRATVKSYANAKPLAVVLVNVSGDVYNALGSGGGSTVNLTGINGVTPSVNAGSADTGTLRVVIVSDQGVIPVSGSFTAQVTAPSFQTIGGLVGISGDSRVSQGGGWAVSLTGDAASPINTKPSPGQVWPVREQGVTGVQIVGGSVGGTFSQSGDSYVNQRGAWATAITGDVLLRSNPNNVIGQIGGTVGVNVVGGSIGGRFSISGDSLNVVPQGVVGVYLTGGTGHGTAGVSGDVQSKQAGAWAVAITGDVLLRAGGPTLNVAHVGPIGAQVVGGSIGGTFSASGDLPVKPQAGLTKFPVSGDTRLIDGSDPTIKATVKQYTRSNPLTVVLVNSSGDAYNAANDIPILLTVAGRAASAGSNSIVAAVPGRRIKVISYSLQGDGDNSRGYFASGASGTQLTTEWELASREGVVKTSDALTFLFATTAGAALSFESSSSKPMKYSATYHVDDAS